MNINHTDKPYVIGLDLGGTNSVFGIVDKQGNIKASTSIKTKGFENAEDYLKASLEALSKIIEETGASTATISRVNKSLEHGADGYKLVLARLAEKKE